MTFPAPHDPATLVVFAVVAARFLVPLLIPVFPVPGIVAAITLDSLDQGIFEAVLGAGLPGYESYDKALDIYSLTICMLAMLRNWRSRPAVQIGRTLYYIRLLGVLAFELTGWRPLLFLFPNVFEYFFGFYEVARTRWSPERATTRTLVRMALVIWIVIKIPQEYWVHVAQLDLTDILKTAVLRMPVTGGRPEVAAEVLISVAAVVVMLAGVLLVRAKGPPPEHPLVLAAARPRGAAPSGWERYVATHWRVLDARTVEKVVLVGFLSAIFVQIVPGAAASPAQLVAGVTGVVLFNSILLLRGARRDEVTGSAIESFVLLAVTNIGLVMAVDFLLRRHYAGLSLPVSIFFLVLLSLIVTLYDRWGPRYEGQTQDLRPRTQVVAGDA